MNEGDQLLLLSYLDEKDSMCDIDSIISDNRNMLVDNPNLIEHHFINVMKDWVVRVKDNPNHYSITLQGKNRLSDLQRERREKILAEKLTKINIELNQQAIETSIAAKAAHDATLEHNPKVRSLMRWNIATAGSAVFIGLVSLITTIIIATKNEQARKQGQETQKILQQQVQVLDSLGKKIQSLDTLHVHVQIDSSKTISVSVLPVESK